jgi:hypothetical protein
LLNIQFRSAVDGHSIQKVSLLAKKDSLVSALKLHLCRKLQMSEKTQLRIMEISAGKILRILHDKENVYDLGKAPLFAEVHNELFPFFFKKIFLLWKHRLCQQKKKKRKKWWK